jgi:hypothetical protein
MRRLEDAREFAGADWQHLSLKSRRELLKRNGKSEVFFDYSWWQLPPSVKAALIKPLMKGPEIIHA